MAAASAIVIATTVSSSGSLAGAERSGTRDANGRKAAEKYGRVPGYTATATPWLVQSGGEANYVEGGDAHASVRLRVSSLHPSAGIQVTRRACADARRGLATICAAVSERAAGGTGVAPLRTSTRSETCRSARKAIAFYVRRVDEWRTKMGQRAIPAHQQGVAPSGVDRCPRYLARLWRAKARAARLRYERWFHKTYEKWRCIHEHEGAWNANTGNGYYGGLQMTRWFQQTYGPEFYRRYGTADRWPVWAQLLAAERAWRECRCFRQWGTAGGCGLR